MAGRMVSLKELFTSAGMGLPKKCFPPDMDRQVKGLTSDSRKVTGGTVFFALQGHEQDGHQYVQDAIRRGCLAVVAEKEIDSPGKTMVIIVADSQKAYGRAAAAFYNFPAREMTVIGLTGTNGKTTTSWIIEEMLKENGMRPGVIGTVNYRYTGQAGTVIMQDASLTTPEPDTLQCLLRQMADGGASHVIIEVSSHALDQQRLAGVEFDIGVFTNLSRDHLDYHESMDRYFSAKQKLFREGLKHNGCAVVVIEKAGDEPDDLSADWGGKLAHLLAGEGFAVFPGGIKQKKLITCGLNVNGTIAGEILDSDIHGISCRFNFGGKNYVLRSELIGCHNALNMLAAAGVGTGLGLKPAAIIKGLQGVRNVPGRLERVVLPPYADKSAGPVVFVDYAHTPDALQNVLQTLRPVTPGHLYCIVGCGGNRDLGKRPMMGEMAARGADRIVITSDNPRNENPDTILEQIETGLRHAGVKKVGLTGLTASAKAAKVYALHEDRRQAIHSVCSQAGKNDVVLVAGKGHETYQITAEGKRFFDDRIEVKNARLRWTESLLLQAAAGRLQARGQGGLLGSVSTDSRNIKANDVFVAMRGEQFDGHDFVNAAVSKGAGAVVVSSPVQLKEKNVSVILVPDTLTALGNLAGFRRRALAGPVQVIAITGSSGKTTVKEMTAAIMAMEYGESSSRLVLWTKGNLNNLIGLPLTLLGINAGHRAVVLEMGMNRSGEIGRLTEIADPDIGCINNIQEAHLEGLGSIEGVARAKGELFSGMRADAIRVVNFDNILVRRLARQTEGNIMGFAVTASGRAFNPLVKVTRIANLGERGMRFTLHVGAWKRRITVPAMGVHNVGNCAAAAAIATAAGIQPEGIVNGLVQYRSYDKRMQVTGLPGGINVVNDSYNANPASMAAALKTAVNLGGNCRRAAVLGDMLELGDESAAAHAKIGALAGHLGYDYLAVTGSFASAVAASAKNAGMAVSHVEICRDTDAAARWVAGLVAAGRLRQGDWLLLKGSRGMRMERVLASLETLLL